jgi:outer membrane protein assembly factor BamB
LRLSFRTRPQSTVQLYRPALQWPMYGVDASRTQSQTGIRLRPPFRELWEADTGSMIEFPAVVSDGVAYVGNFHGTVFAFAMNNGKRLWRRLQPNGKMASSPAVWGDRLVVHGMDGVVRVLARSNGRLLAQFAAGSPIESSPVVRDGIDYFGTWNGRVYALDLRRMRVRWTFTSGCKLTSSVAIAGGTVYIGDYCGRLLALLRTTGRERWSGAVNGRIYGTPAVAAGRVFVPSSDGGSLSAFSTGGRFLWRRYAGSYVYSSPAVWRGRVFFGAYNGVFYALSAASGRTLWTTGLGGPISGAAVVVDGVAYAGSFAHRILGVDAASGRVLLDFPHGEYVPVSGDGGRLLLHGYSRLYAVTSR